MNEYYYVGTVKYTDPIFGLSLVGFVKIPDGGHLSAGYLVKFRIGKSEKIGTVLTAGMIKRGSDDEAVLLANTDVYEAEAVYHESWAKVQEKEAEENGN